jgi:hypothetical protein
MTRRILAATCGLFLAAAASAQSAELAAPLASDAGARKAACEAQPVQRVTLVPPAGLPVVAVDRATAAVSYWLRPPFGTADLGADYAVRVGRGRAVELTPAASSDVAIVEAGRTAISMAVSEGAFDAIAPDSGGAPVALRVLVGRTPEGRRTTVARRVCMAVARGDNRPMLFPPELRIGSSETPDGRTVTNVTEGRATARFRVDSLGNVVPGTVSILSATHPAFGQEVLRDLPSLRFYPASIDGRPLAQVVEQEFTFSESFRAGARRTAG